MGSHSLLEISMNQGNAAESLKTKEGDKIAIRLTWSAHACSEVGLKWFLFAIHDSGTALGFISGLDFFGDFVFLEHRRNGQTGKRALKGQASARLGK
jgi:hypothetical protein